MKVIQGGARVILYECAGFGLILLLSVLNSVSGLPHLLAGGEGEASRWRYGLVEAVIILLIWALVFSITRRLLRRLHHLEGMLRVCAWCRKIGHGNKWMRIEDYFAEGLHIGTTHGICPDCLKRVEDDTKEFRQRECADRPASGAQNEHSGGAGTKSEIRNPRSERIPKAGIRTAPEVPRFISPGQRPEKPAPT